MNKGCVSGVKWSSGLSVKDYLLRKVRFTCINPALILSGDNIF